MKLLIALEHHFTRGADGCIYTPGPPRYSYWHQYLEVFEEVVVLARVGEATGQMPREQRADGSGVAFWPLPNYTGPAQYLRKLVQLRSTVREAVIACDAYLLVLPGAVGNLAAREIRRLGRVYATQIVADPWDTFSPGAARMMLRPVYRWLLTRLLRQNCYQAVAAAYVTQRALQSRYPAGPAAYTCSFSDAILEGHLADAATIERRKQRTKELFSGLRQPAQLGFAGSLEMHHKGADVLLQAVAICLREGLSVKAHLAGDGRARLQFEALARKLGVSSAVHFHGHIPAGKTMFEFFDSIDIFVMPSRHEGLPRALLEAMARGCPCIASMIGGIPELLPPEALVPPSDPKQLAGRIRRFLSDQELVWRMIERNAEVARSYRLELLRETQHVFLNEVRARLARANLHDRAPSSLVCRPPESK